MQYGEFVGQVQARAQLGSNGDAVRAIRATLQALADRLQGSSAYNLAAQLPRELGIYLRTVALGELSLAERLSLRDFYERVAAREQVDLPIAIHHARVVMQVLQEAVSPGEMEKIRAQLPAEFSELFEANAPQQRPATRAPQRPGSINFSI